MLILEIRRWGNIVIKVCIISGSFPYDKCGVGDYASMLALALSKKNIGVSVITSCRQPKKIENVEVFNSINNWSIENLRKVLEIIEQIKPNIINIQYPTIAYEKKILINVLPLILKIKGYKVVSTFHEYSSFGIIGKLRIESNLLASDSIIIVDKIYENDIKKKLLFMKKEINFINIGSNIPKSAISEIEITEKKKMLIRDNNKKIIGYFGFITESKGIESILKAMQQLKKDRNLNSILLMITEFNDNNEYHQSLLNLIEELNLKNDIIITGYLKDKDVADYLATCDFIVLPFVDGFSPKNGSMISALQEGKIVITTKGESMVNYIEGLKILDRYDDINQLANYIEEFQKSDNIKVSSFSDRFSWNSIAQKYIDIFNKLID